MQFVSGQFPISENRISWMHTIYNTGLLSIPALMAGTFFFFFNYIEPGTPGKKAHRSRKKAWHTWEGSLSRWEENPYIHMQKYIRSGIIKRKIKRIKGHCLVYEERYNQLHLNYTVHTTTACAHISIGFFGTAPLAPHSVIDNQKCGPHCRGADIFHWKSQHDQNIHKWLANRRVNFEYAKQSTVNACRF